MPKHPTRQLAPAALACLLGILSAWTASGQQSYRLVEWPLPATTAAGTPSPWHFGEVAAVATTSQGTILVFHRGASPIMEFDVSGKFLKSHDEISISGGKVTGIAPEDRGPGGSGYTAVYGPAACYACGAHSIRVDEQGSIWIVDAAAHAVYKTNASGKLLLQLGEKGVSGTDRSHFNLPTDVAFGRDGAVYVTDGYGSARVVKYSADGDFLLEWGTRGTGPGEFGLPHNLAVDAEGRVYVTDRDNQRVQVFDADGKFLDQWKDVGGISTLYMTADQRLWAGGVLRNIDGTVAVRLPVDPGGHGTTVAPDGSVFVAQLSGIVQKFEPVP